MESIMAQILVATWITCATVWIVDPTVCCRRNTVETAVWKPFGVYKGHILYERTYESGKRSWRYENKDGEYVYMGTTTVQNEIITPL